MRHIPEQFEPDAPLPQGDAGDAYPVNEQHLEDFNVGGVERSLPPEQQLEQLVSYMESSYPVPDAADRDACDRYLAALPDRLTHAAMLMLGSGLDHTMPGVAYGAGVGLRELPEVDACLFTPSGGSEPSGRWAVSANPGFGPRGLEHYWRPLVAAVAQLSGTTIVDVDTSCPETLAAALGFISNQAPAATALWSTGEDAREFAEQHSVAFADAGALLYPCDGYVSASIGGNGIGEKHETSAQPGIIATPEEFRRIVHGIARNLANAGI